MRSVLPCEIFPTCPAKTFLERNPFARIIKVEVGMRIEIMLSDASTTLSLRSARWKLEVQDVERDEGQVLGCARELSNARGRDGKVWRQYTKCGGAGRESHDHPGCRHGHHPIGAGAGANKTDKRTFVIVQSSASRPHTGPSILPPRVHAEYEAAHPGSRWYA
jgi:hypothetical protein